MFDNQNFFLKQERVNGSGIPPGIVNIDRVNADELDATSDQIAGRILGQVGMMLEVFLGCPVLVPTAMHEYSSSSELLALEEAGINGQCLVVVRTNDNPFQISEPLSTYL